MAEEQSSLRTAIDKIMGWPAGGTPSGGGGAGVTSAPAPAQSSGVNLGTTSAIQNLVPEAVADPFEAQLAEIRAQNDALSASLAATTTPATPVAAAAPAAPAWKSPQTLARESSPAASGEWGGANEYIASKLGGYDWRGKASQVGMTADEYYGGPMSGENAYIASKIGNYDWRGKVPQISQYSAEYKALQKPPV